MPFSRKASGSQPMAAARRRNSASSLPQQTVWATEYVMDEASRPAAWHASRTRANAAAESATVLNGTLYSSAYVAASRGVRRAPAPPRSTGGCGRCAGFGSAGESESR
jgi:hypothetical protein